MGARCTRCGKQLQEHEQGPDGSRMCPRTTFRAEGERRADRVEPGSSDGEMRYDGRGPQNPRTVRAR